MRSTTTRGGDNSPLLHAYCHLCERWRVLDPADRDIARSKGSSPPAVARCPDCGEFGLVKARPQRLAKPLAAMLAVDDLPPEHWRTPD